MFITEDIEEKDRIKKFHTYLSRLKKTKQNKIFREVQLEILLKCKIENILAVFFVFQFQLIRYTPNLNRK